MNLSLNRRELKFFLTRQEAVLLESRLAHVLEPDPHMGKEGYFVRSLYFDDCLSTSFHERIEGFEERTKIRLRLYDFHSTQIKFELKQKRNDLVIKETAPFRRADIPKLEAGDWECLLDYRNSVLRKAYYRLKRNYFRPVVVVDYLRKAYSLSYNHIRVTLDSGLRRSREVEGFGDKELFTLPVLQNDHIILEVKFDQFLPSWLGALFRPSRFVRLATSKYCLSRLI